MVNNPKNQKAIEQIRKQLHAVASQPPREDPFSRAGAQAWQEWTEVCRGFESELREANY